MKPYFLLFAFIVGTLASWSEDPSESWDSEESAIVSEVSRPFVNEVNAERVQNEFTNW